MKYRNPWHEPGSEAYGPAEYESEARPREYRGHLIVERIKRACWDVVKDGRCVAQRATGACVDGEVDLGPDTWTPERVAADRARQSEEQRRRDAAEERLQRRLRATRARRGRSV